MAKESKKTFVLRLDANTYQQLEKWAADEFRSINGQLEYLVSRALKEAGRSKNTDPPNGTNADTDKDA
ncbi:MAG TPA: hypothetical protein VLC98_08995 [Phnomibacter sp.]|nr:hypothetical protein [Phnomibacter sp.]